MAFLIGDTIRLNATIKNLDDVEEAPAEVKLTIYSEDGTTKLLTDEVAILKDGTTAQYYVDWKIDTITAAETLIAVWSWTGPHIKKVNFECKPAV